MESESSFTPSPLANTTPFGNQHSLGPGWGSKRLLRRDSP